MAGKRLFIVSNRLPLNVEVTDEQTEIKPSSGGLVSAISSFLEDERAKKSTKYKDTYWVGVPGCTPAVWSSAGREVQSEDYKFLPVFINKKIYDAYYNGLSNSMLWPLFHYFPSYAEFNSDAYGAYKKANEEFLSVLLKQLQPDDVVWIHDYHLLPLAAMIRKEIPGITIGFFLHIPFPSHEIYKIMPKEWQEYLLDGMLGADLIGFHTIDYASHFLKTVQMVFGIQNEKNIVEYKDRLIKTEVFPISIDYDKFNNAWDDKDVKAQRQALKKQFDGRKIIFSVDRLDYTKGVYNRLKAYEYFLSNYPEYIGKVVFIMNVVPSRDSISKYAERKKLIDEYIGNLLSTVGTINWQPIIYQYANLELSELVAMYTCCDLALITPIRDGMNLVAKEFVASRKDERGVLVLSEMAGAARELNHALIINPIDIEEIALKIKEGLEMTEPEQAMRMKAMRQAIAKYTVNIWAADFFRKLEGIKNKQKEFEVKFLDNDSRMELLGNFSNAKNRLFLLDYDGTLRPFVSHPALAKPDDHLLEILKTLSEDKRNHIYIISGRDSHTLGNWVGHLPVNIVAEHGAKFKNAGQDWQNETTINTDWLPAVEEIMMNHAMQCEKSFVEKKEFSIAWHYRNVEAAIGDIVADELFNELQQYASSLKIKVVKGNKIIEVRNKGVNKGMAVSRILKEGKYDFIMACGDDTTDEDMFRQLVDIKNAYTIKIGPEASYAKYNLYTPQMMTSLLNTLKEIIAHSGHTHRKSAGIGNN